MAKSTSSREDLSSEAVRLLRCLTARDMARTGVTHEAIGKFLKIAKAEVGPLVQGIKRPKGEK